MLTNFTVRDSLIRSMRERGTLWSETTLSRITHEIRERVAWRLRVAPNALVPAMAPNTAPDPYPLDDGSTFMTYEEIGQHLGVTRERVRQIEGRALHKLEKALLRAYSALPARAHTGPLSKRRRLAKEEFLF
jgi:hypothetical protein